MNGNAKWILSGALAVVLGIAGWGLTSWASGITEAIAATNRTVEDMRTRELEHVSSLSRIEAVLNEMRDLMRKEQ